MVNVISVRVYPKTIETNPGLWYYGAVAEVCPACATCTGVVWHSSDTSVATVNESNGYIYAKSAGTAKIYATAVDGSGKNDYLTITVRNSPIMVESISLNKTSISLEIGDEYTLSTTICPENAANKSVIWSSSNTNIASVDNGVVTARAVGSAVIQATAADGSGKSSCCTVSVTEDVLVSSVEINPERIKLVMGKSASLCATVCPTNATEKCLRWTSSDMEVAIVNPASGIVTARNAGEATIYATATDGSGKYGSCEVEVVEPIYVESITVCPENLTMNVGEKETMCATICPTNATNKSVMWTSSDTNVATVGFYTGIVEAVGPGEVAIRATSVDGSHVDCCIIKVLNPFDVKYINITKDNSGKYSIILTKFNNDDFYFQAYGEENDEWGELYSLSWTNINWLNDTYNSYYSTYISQGNVNTSLIGHRVYLAKNKLINTINAGIWNITVNSDEFYGMWMHYTRVEVAYLEASQLVAQMLQTAVVIGTTIYKAVVTIKSIATLINQRKYISSESYQSTINGINAMNQTGPDVSQYSSTTNLLGVQNTENFKPGSINHVLKGEINKNGNAVGYHYEGFSDSAGSIIIGTKTNANEYGVYKAKVSVNGINKISNNGYSTFFPKTMSPQQIIDATNQAYNNRKLAQGNTYIGVADNGLEIAMYLDNADKIVSFFPIY